MKKIIWLIMIVCLACSIYAEPDLFYKKGSMIDIKTACSSLGTSCVNAACNISVAYPDSTIMVNNQQMTKTGLFYNYTLPDSSILGEYQCVVACQDQVGNATTTFSFQVTNNGFFNNDYTVIIAIAICAIILFFFVFKITDTYLQFLLLVFGILFALLIPAYFMIRNTLQIFYYVFTGLIVVITVYLIIYMSKFILEKLGLFVNRGKK